ncbi:two-component hybrid sensor and regulator [Lunatimonas lonarensis]|uniref:Two-component hybrid sensor and regulator n=1 Tax=Lunatimonas lonarensis TaxID=1232681 RepID=R7ZQS3_9BACT|nr:response regulator [Lunatimonas lonarensis]EON76465.1 two-component hybrid sensor and regulator [Lunatimonas lonarensis]
MTNRVIIVEDDSDLAENYSELIEQLGYKVLGVFDNAPSVLYFLKATQPDLILLDIKIKGEFDGIDLARVIQRDYSIPVLFMTAYSDDSTLEHAFLTTPVNYLVKPISRETFKTALHLASSRISTHKGGTDNRRIKIREKGYVTYLFSDEIVALQAEGLYTMIVTRDRNTFTERKLLKDFHAELPQHQFIRVHKSHVVNIHHIKSFNSKHLLAGHLRIPLRRGLFSKLSRLMGTDERNL